MKSTWTTLLIIGTVLPLVLLLWPFAMWGAAASLILRVIAAACGQALFCMLKLPRLLKGLPFAGTLCLALWGTWLYCTSSHWVNATLSDLLADYVSPAISCAAVLIAGKWIGHKGKTDEEKD